jgi:O-antigen/teichoic acid export membrane protein
MISEPMAARLFNDHLWMAKICSVIILIDCCNETMYNYFRTFQQIKRYSLYVTIMTATNFIAIASLVHFGYGIAGAVIGFLLSEAVTCLLMISDVVFQIGVKIPGFSKMRDYLTFGINTVPSSVSSWAVSSSDRYVIGLLLGTSFVGYYSPGYNLGNILIIIIAPFSFILPSALSKYYDEQNVDAVRTILSQSLRYFLTLAIPSAFGISILSFSILRMLTTPEIAAHGYMITPFVAVSALIFGVYVVISHILILEKKTSALSKVWFIAAALNLGLNFMLVPSLGIIGGALTTLIAYSLALILTAYASFKYFNFPINIYFIIKILLSSIVMSLVFLVWYPADKLSIIICVFVCAAVYFIVLFLLGGYKIKEILFFRDLVKI